MEKERSILQITYVPLGGQKNYGDVELFSHSLQDIEVLQCMTKGGEELMT